MLDKNYSSKDWEKMWNELDSLKEVPSFVDEKKIAHTKNIKHSDFGIGAAMMAEYQDPIQGLIAEIRKGSGHIEFAPSIGGHGSGYHTFTKVGAEQRRAMRELKHVNNVTIHTHAHAGISGLTGFNEQNFSFDDKNRQNAIDEVKKAIDFAADVAEGGSITFHAGEFTRPLSGQRWGEKGEEFEMSSDEKDNMIFALIDKETKRHVEGGIFRANQKMVVPVLDYDNEIKLYELSDNNGKEEYAIPGLKKNKITGKVETEEFDNFKQYAAWLVEKDEKFRKSLKEDDPRKHIKKIQNEKGIEVGEISDYYILEKAAKRRFEDMQKIKLAQSISQASRSTNILEGEISEIQKTLKRAENQAKARDIYILKNQRGQRYPEIINKGEFDELLRSGKISDNDYQEIKKGSTIKDIENLGFNINCFHSGDVRVNQVENKLRELELEKESAKHNIKQEFDKLNDTKSPKYYTMTDFALEQNKKSFEQLGIELYEKNKALRKRNPDARDMYFAVENLFPEKHGAHPDELIKIIGDARQAMSEKLKQTYKLDDKKAKEVAENSIKATFDTGHLHMWKRYFKRNEKESEEKFNERFNQWALSQTQKLIEKKMIGNVHLADNFGYDDDHVTLGQGTVPIKEYMEMFDKARYEGKMTGKFAVEGFDDSKERHGVHEAWKQSGVDVFKSQMATDRWVNLEETSGRPAKFYNRNDSYLGNGHKPYFIFGKYSPDPEDWAPWDGMGLE